MSKRSRKANDFSPSTFPFLAVLLCTIGALVLILVVTVVHSRASANKVAQAEYGETLENAKEQSDYLVSISEELQARRERVKKELERRRRELSHIEDHIERLKDELSKLKSQTEQASSQTAVDELEDKERKIATLEEQLAKKKDELSKIIKERKDKPPAFSIIPYEGPNGTARRPVYLECRADGLVIQPEGIKLTLQELAPPHGPGNPLDAALRVLRTAYQAKDTTYGITTPPYPLLIVRPDGIHTYALARAAMSGWDDQYGYELVEADRDLVFPPGVQGLENELQKSLAIARERQAALVASLPARFRRDPFELEHSSNTWDDEAAVLSDGAGQGTSSATIPSNSLSASNGQSNWGDEAESENGRWKMLREVQMQGNNSPTFRGASSRDFVTMQSPKANATANPSATSPANPYPQAGSPNADKLLDTSDTFASNPSAYSPSIKATSGEEGNKQRASEGNSESKSERNREGANQGNGAEGEGMSESGSLTPNGAQSTNPASNANRFSSGAAAGSAMGASNLVPDDAQAHQSAALREYGMKQDANDAQPWNKRPSESQSNGTKNSSSNRSSNRTPDGDLKPISVTAGKDWATTRMDNRSTPVSRPIRIIVLDDRWLLRNEQNPSKYDTEILLEEGPQVAGAKLKEAIRDRVESWGPSLPGGYWTPALSAETASDAQKSLSRLQRLLDSSGAILQIQPLTAQQSTPTPQNPKR